MTTTANPKLCRGDNLYSVTETWVFWKAGQARVTGPCLMVPSLSSVPSLVEYLPVITGKQTNKKPKQQPKQQQTQNTTTMDCMLFACMARKIQVKGLKTRHPGWVLGVCITSLGISVASQSPSPLSQILLLSPDWPRIHCPSVHLCWDYRCLRRYFPCSVPTDGAFCSYFSHHTGK